MKILLLIIIVLISCSPPVNTWDPMVSENIMTSKKNGLFIAQYNIGKDSLCSLIKEAWVENGWHNESKLGWGESKIKKVENSLQLILKLDIHNNSLLLNSNQFPNDWYFICLPEEKFLSRGQYSNMSTFHLRSYKLNELPATLEIKFINKGITSKSYCTVSLKKQ